MTIEIGKKCCATCGFSDEKVQPGTLSCVLSPPSVHLMTGHGPNGTPVMQPMSIFPPVMPQWWCGKHVNKAVKSLRESVGVGAAIED